MLIDLKEHLEFVFGAVSIKKENNGSLRFRRQTDELYSIFQHDGYILWNYMAGSPAAILTQRGWKFTATTSLPL